jgi:4'-phosphopantetheinyl transferase
MKWIEQADKRVRNLPAAWLVETGLEPATQVERSIVRRDIAQKIVAVQTGLDLQAVVIAHDRAGRPVVAGQSDLHISYATRGGAVLVALAHQVVGCDVEAVDDGEIPWNVLTADEQLYLRAMAGQAQRLAFTQIWAAKEAAGKCLGVGLSPSIEAATIQPVSAGLWRMRANALPLVQIHTRPANANGQHLVLAVAMRV